MGMKKLIFLSLIAVTIFLFTTPGISQENSKIKLDIEGNCTKFNVTLSAFNFSQGCYDVKIDINSPTGRVGRIYDPRKGWKSSFFYIKEYFCIEESEKTPKNSSKFYNKSKTFKLKAETKGQNVSFKGKLRIGSSSYESSFYTIEQNCPQDPDMDLGSTGLQREVIILALLLSILFLLAGITFYKKNL